MIVLNSTHEDSAREDRMIYTLVLEYQGTSNFNNTGTFAQVDISLDPSLRTEQYVHNMQKIDWIGVFSGMTSWFGGGKIGGCMHEFNSNDFWAIR